MPTEEEMKKDGSVRLCWTGGWDSTFRLLQLLFAGHIPVKPIYIINPIRASSPQEMRAMEQIRSELSSKHPERADLLLPTRLVNFTEIRPDPGLTDRFNRLASKGHLGTQYEWIARFASQERFADLELAVHRDDKAHAFLENAVRTVQDESGAVRVLKSEFFDTDLGLFRFFRFPLFDYTKIQMKEEATRQGFAPLLHLTWFCHSPRPDGRPCGACAGCVYTRDEGLGERVPAPPFLKKVLLQLSQCVPWRIKRRIKIMRGSPT